ncbi:MAG: hypothetical protein A2589_00735 [Candidatus Vogelbacteria bacterium RIFOXYD1_FULL_46_19]|uniref:Uncharacterized protein n=1 Tax=Candidatus Vogelbacteria bacterium RIFOXYD1_FULL_46_19 TaxID=1802439 RepID=A0A1G2QFJ2_9BACT|nr:MAG: hypothetical protein A2589_00735 [Candidatus Vogelbacteria bacterium RIFOXYD1_FULL_46_19]
MKKIGILTVVILIIAVLHPKWSQYRIQKESARTVVGMCEHDALAMMSLTQRERYLAAKAESEKKERVEWDREGTMPAEDYYRLLFKQDFDRSQPAGTAKIISKGVKSFALYIEGAPLRNHFVFARRAADQSAGIVALAPSLIEKVWTGEEVPVSRFKRNGDWLYFVRP